MHRPCRPGKRGDQLRQETAAAQTTDSVHSLLRIPVTPGAETRLSEIIRADFGTVRPNRRAMLPGRTAGRRFTNQTSEIMKMDSGTMLPSRIGTRHLPGPTRTSQTGRQRPASRVSGRYLMNPIRAEGTILGLRHKRILPTPLRIGRALRRRKSATGRLLA